MIKICAAFISYSLFSAYLQAALAVSQLYPFRTSSPMIFCLDFRISSSGFLRIQAFLARDSAFSIPTFSLIDSNAVSIII